MRFRSTSSPCLRHLLKFMSHMYDHNAGTHDRLLRNLIDTPQVLGGLRNVMENGNIFGSNVWSAAVNIMSSFIHNEPTSFQVVNEAGLVKSLLGAVVPWELDESNQDETKLEDMPIALEYKDGELQYPTPSGILPLHRGNVRSSNCLRSHLPQRGWHEAILVLESHPKVHGHICVTATRQSHGGGWHNCHKYWTIIRRAFPPPSSNQGTDHVLPLWRWSSASVNSLDILLSTTERELSFGRELLQALW